MSKDIREYLHYYLGKVKVRHRYVDYEQGIWTVWEKLTIDHYDRLLNDFSIDGIEIELRKLESMTEREATEFVNIGELDKGRKLREITEYAVHFFDRGSYGAIEFGTLHPQHFHYLLSKGFDLFNLIESGAAINKEHQ